MVFDKTKSMRSAERHLAQGKVQSAINEYKQVVANDPKDFGTLNMLGDLYTKNSEKKQAVDCYTLVAEHYSKQGFAQKAIALYNKISKLQPGSMDITEKLGDLYKLKGSVNEARSHYTTVAQHYESLGQRVEALEVRKRIASMDPNDTKIYLDLAAAYLEENQAEEASDAFSEAGARLATNSKHSEAVEAFDKALQLKPLEPKILAAFVQSHFALGSPAAAAERLAEILATNPGDRDVLHLLIDCHLQAGNTAEAEKAIISVVEKEPASYQKLLDLARIYLKDRDAEAAARIVSIACEHMLLAGQADEFQTFVTEIRELDPEQLEGLRLQARFSAWQRDEAGMYDALVQLAVVAMEMESIDDERFALSQLVMIAPHEIKYAERLREINEQYGFDDAYSGDNLFDEQFLKPAKQADPELETFAAVPFEAEADDDLAVAESSAAAFEIIDAGVLPVEQAETIAGETEEERLGREVDSIKFYIDSEYFELAGKAIGELRAEFGERPEIAVLVSHLEQQAAAQTSMPVEEVGFVNLNGAADDASGFESNGKAEDPQGFGTYDLRSELGIDEVDATDDSDYDTHYHTAVAYQEMGLLDEAIKEFQEAVGLVQPNDPNRRFFHCANLLGHCFMQKAMPNLALTWYQRALETPALSDEEKQGIWYELASAYEAEGDMDSAGRYFEQVYAENIDFRDVSERVRNISVSR